MTEIVDSGIGQRIAKYRKLAGFRSSNDLAKAIKNPKITASVVQNIESGRTTNVSVSQLLDISKALDLSPSFLLVPIEDPMARVDIDGVSTDVAMMKSFEVEAWISGTSISETPAGSAAQRILLEMRHLSSTVARYRESIALHRSQLEEQVRMFGRSLNPVKDPEILWPGGYGHYSTAVIASSAKYLAKAGIDLSWAQDVIDDANRHMRAERGDDVVDDTSD